MAKLTNKQKRKRKKNSKKQKQKRLLARKEKERNKLQPWAPVKMKLFQMPEIMPKDIPKEKRLEIIRHVGSKAREEFENKYPRILEWFNNYDPLYLLSYCAYYFLTHPEGTDPEVSGSLDFYPFYLEILQAFALTQNRSFSAKPLMEESVRLKKEMSEIGQSILFKMFEFPQELAEDDELHSYHLRTEMMSHTIAIRNWAYLHQMKRITLDLAKLIDDSFKARYKIHASSIISLLFKLLEVIEDKMNDHRRRIQRCFQKKTHQEIIAAYNEAFPDINNIEGEGVDQIWEYAAKNRKNLLWILLCHSDLQLEKIYSFNLGQAYSLIDDDCSIHDLRNVLDQLSFNFCDLNEYNKEYIILNNPVNRKPFIKTDKDIYYSSIWYTIPHFALGILENMLQGDPGLKSKYSDFKSRYLEDEIERIVRRGFPRGEIVRGIKWTDPSSNKTYENDIVVIIDSFAIIFEAKSGMVSDPAKRGAPNDLFETLKRLIEEPSEQALRLIEYLKSNKKEHVFKDIYGKENKIDSKNINYYIPIGITFNELGRIASNIKKLIKANIVDKKLEELAPSMCFTDLEIVFDLLPLEAEKVHYLARRREFEAHVEYEGDEISLLAFYLEYGFNIGDDEYSKDKVFNIDLKSKELDPYIVGSNEGVKIKKPELEMTKWWRDILCCISTRKIVGWIETSYVLLNCRKEDQVQFEKSINTLERQMIKGKTSKPHNWVICALGPERRRYIIVGYPYITEDKELRNNIMDQILNDEEVEKSRGAVIIGRDMNNNDYPYSVLVRRMSTELFDTLTID